MRTHLNPTTLARARFAMKCFSISKIEVQVSSLRLNGNSSSIGKLHLKGDCCGLTPSQ